MLFQVFLFRAGFTPQLIKKQRGKKKMNETFNILSLTTTSS